MLSHITSQSFGYDIILCSIASHMQSILGFSVYVLGLMLLNQACMQLNILYRDCIKKIAMRGFAFLPDWQDRHYNPTHIFEYKL